MAMTNNNMTYSDTVVKLAKVGHKKTVEGFYDKIINALEIDWNAAKLPDANPANGGQYGPINDTVQLLDLINTMQKEIYVLTAAVIALAQR